MFTFNGRDAHRALVPAKVHLPFQRQIGDILPEKTKSDDDVADPALLRLPAPGLRGTWARAYSLLTRLVSDIGWDELLKTRSVVFVMEEEYRMQKAQADIQKVVTSNGARDVNKSDTVIHEDGSVTAGSATLADDDASTRGMSSPLSESESKPEIENGLNVSAIPIIRVSSESDTEREIAESTRNGIAEQDEATESASVQSMTLEKPMQAAAGEELEPSQSSNSNQEAFSFTNKRLCERWLDNLFMVLYEDLRVWTIFRAEVAHFKTQHVAYRKTGLEWEILGDLGIRLHHKEEAKEAYQRCLDTSRYSQKPWAKLLEMYAEEGDITRTIQAAIRVAAYQYADYTEMTYPTLIARCFFKLGQIHGHAKISFTLLSMGLPDPILKIMDSYLQYGKTFKVEGYDF
jgi:hypothetical protein